MGRGDLLIVATVGVMHHLMSNHFKKLILIYHFGPIYSQCRYTKEIEGAASAKALGFLLQSDKYVFLYSMILVSDHFNSYSLVGNCACVFALYSGNQCINP